MNPFPFTGQLKPQENAFAVDGSRLWLSSEQMRQNDKKFKPIGIAHQFSNIEMCISTVREILKETNSLCLFVSGLVDWYETSLQILPYSNMSPLCTALKVLSAAQPTF